MPDQDVANGILLEQRIINRQYSAAGIAKNHLNALLRQSPEENLSTRTVFRGGGCGGGGGGHDGSVMI
jgi:hypothetical protein